MKIQTTIQKWGNNLAIRITGPLKNIPHSITSKKQKFVLLKESELLKGLTAKTAHADEFLENN